MLAAGAIVAIEEMVERLADDHARAHRLAVGARRPVPGLRSTRTRSAPTSCAPAPIGSRRPSSPCSSRRGIRAGTIDLETVRLVTHKDIDDADVDRTIAAFDALALEAVEARRTRWPDRRRRDSVAATE